MKKRVFLILIASLLLLCACQPTPEEPFVIGKDNEAMIEKATETGAPAPTGESLYEALGVPETYTIDLKNEAARVIVQGEARVVLPEADRLPLAYVQAARFSQEQVYAFFRTLTAGKAMYDMPNDTPKWAIEKQIKEQQDRLNELLAQGKGDEDGEVRACRETISDLQQDYQNAPEEVTLVPIDGTLQTYEMNFLGKYRGTATGFVAVSAPFEKVKCSFRVTDDADYADSGSYTFIDEDGNVQVFTPDSGSSLLYYRQSDVHLGTWAGANVLLDVTKESETGAAVQIPDGLTIEGHLSPETLLLSVTPAEARKQAETLITQCGVENMTVDGVYLLTNQQPLYPDWVPADYLAEQRALPEHQAYAVRFLRKVAGVPVESFFGISQVKVDDSGYGPQWYYEVLEVAVDDEGIQAVHWTGPLEVESIITDQAALLPFSQIQEIFEKMMPVVYANYGMNSDFLIEVNEVRLCLWRIFDKDSYTRGILAPVWCFYGSLNGLRGTEFLPILILNAVDGSVIDPRNGY